MPRGRKPSGSSSSLNIILREPEQVLLMRACIDRLSKARGGVKISGIQALLDLAKIYLENADKIDPITPAMSKLMEKKKEINEAGA